LTGRTRQAKDVRHSSETPLLHYLTDRLPSSSKSTIGLSAEDRREIIRRIGDVTKRFAAAGLIGINSFISPS